MILRTRLFVLALLPLLFSAAASSAEQPIRRMCGAGFEQHGIGGTGAPLASSGIVGTGSPSTGHGIGGTGSPVAESGVGGTGVGGTGSPVASSGIVGTGAPATGHGIGGTGSPVAESGMGGTGSPVAGSGIGGTGTPSTGHGIGGTGSPVAESGMGGTGSPIAGSGIGGTGAPVTDHGIGGTGSPVAESGMGGTGAPVADSGIGGTGMTAGTGGGDGGIGGTGIQVAGVLSQATGIIAVIDRNHRVVNLAEGSQICAGDRIETGLQSTAKIEFTDGTQLQLKPSTKLRVEAYAWMESDPASAKFSLALEEGGLRSISGKLSKANSSAYRLSTPDAEIRVIGTDYEVAQLNAPQDGLEPGTYATVNYGRIRIKNAGGSILLKAGQHGVAPHKQAPKRVYVRPGCLPCR